MIYPFVRVIFLIFAFFSVSFAQEPQFQYLKTSDGAMLRLAHWISSKHKETSKTIILLEGRASFIEKHQETVNDLLNQGHDVWVFDWRGHGGSSRLLENPQKVHIDRYETYLKDLYQIVHKAVKPKARSPLVFLGVSFGGHMALRYAAEHGGDVEGMILVAPMLDIKTAPFPYHVARALSRTASLLGLSEFYAVGYGDYDPRKSQFEKNTNTQDRFRYERQRKLCINNMQFVTGGPTYGWVEATFKSIDYISNLEFLKLIKVPTLMISAGLDKVVDNSRDRSLCSKMAACQHKAYSNAYHNILNEITEVRNQFLVDIDQFLRKLETYQMKASTRPYIQHKIIKDI